MGIFTYIFILIHKNGLTLKQGCINDDEGEKEAIKMILSGKCNHESLIHKFILNTYLPIYYGSPMLMKINKNVIFPCMIGTMNFSPDH